MSKKMPQLQAIDLATDKIQEWNHRTQYKTL